LQFSHCGRVTFFHQLKKVTKKSRPYSIAPRKTFGVPEFTAIAYEPVLMRRPGAQD
jgi:hypothetical protein